MLLESPEQRLFDQRLQQNWQLPAAVALEELPGDVQALGLSEPILALLSRRGFGSAAAIEALLNPADAPDPKHHFPDLGLAVKRLKQACKTNERLAICGDYDADGMTSTALLIGVLQQLGAQPQAAIPSRQSDGYGLNVSMVEELAAEGIRLLVTVDNGVSAREALERAQALGLEVIVTDHHTIPEERPPLSALLHPQCTPEDSPYRGLAGVGMAYVLAGALAKANRSAKALAMALDLFCIGTIADMAPLQGVNRRWLMDGLPRLKDSPLPGLQALQQVAGLDDAPIDAGAVGFQLAPRINAVGRLGDPRLVVDLLTTDDPEQALELARECESLNRQRRELCDAIEAEALALAEADGDQRSPFLLLAQSHWHHGVIGIVAARLVEHYGAPVALLAAEGDGRMRASVRAPKGFAVDAALQACGDLLERFGGHPAAGGFTVKAERVTALHERLNDLAQVWREREGLQLVMPEALLKLEQINRPPLARAVTAGALRHWQSHPALLELWLHDQPTAGAAGWSPSAQPAPGRSAGAGHGLAMGSGWPSAAEAGGCGLSPQAQPLERRREPSTRGGGHPPQQRRSTGAPTPGAQLLGAAGGQRRGDPQRRWGRTPGRSRAGPAGSPSDRSPEGGTPLCQSPGPRRSQGDGTGGLETTKPPGENLQGAKRVDEAEA